MAELTKAQIETLGKLMATQRDYLDKLNAIAGEIETIMGGGVGIAMLLKRLEAHYDTCWSVRYSHGQRSYYVWAYVKDRPQMKRLIKMLGVEEIERRMIAYLKNDDPFFVKARHSFGLFVSTVNQHTAESPAAAAADLELSDDVADTRRRREALRG